jgi:hypothetical protein
MTVDTDPAIEDRIRAAFNEMMPVILAERDGSNPRQTSDGDVDLLAVGRIGGIPPRRTSAMAVGLAACVVLVVGGIVLFSRRTAEVDENPAAATTADDDVLLLPPDPPTSNELAQVPPGRWSAAVQSPAGQVLGINLSEDYWGDLPADADVRTIHSLAVGTLLSDGISRDYVALPGCVMLVVSAPATIAPWDTAVTDLWSGLTTNAGLVTVTLPPGWKQLATGPRTEHFNTAFTHAIGTASHEMRLFQARNANVAQFLSRTYSGTASAATLGTSSAWIVHSNDSLQWSYLIWSVGTTAAMLGGQAISDADLIATAQALVPVAPSEWLRRIEASVPSVDPDTVTATTMVPMPVGEQAGCGERTIRFA